MSQKTLRRCVLAALGLAITSAAAVVFLTAEEIMSLHRTVLNVFVQPGVVIWWLLLAGPYQFAPTNLTGYAAIVVANTGCWFLALWFGVALARGSVTRWWYITAAPVLTVASLAIVAMRDSNPMVPSIVRDPLVHFVEPGVTVWWFGVGTLFQPSPSALSGMAFTAVANAAIWLLTFWLLVIASGFLRRKVLKPRP